MKIKLDENVGRRGADLLRQAGHDVETVASQGMCSASDRDLIFACRREGRALVALDLDFGNPLLFDPSEFAGIAVLRLPSAAALEDMLNGIRTLVAGLDQEDVTGRLWMIQTGRIRKYQPD